jgi:ATP-dependent DNA helicase RecQ
MKSKYSEEKSDQIVILPIGAGKSLCFSLPALLLEGPTLIIFPLLALMADQARRLEETGRGVAIIRGGQKPEERKQIWRSIEAGKITYILSNPGNPHPGENRRTAFVTWDKPHGDR